MFYIWYRRSAAVSESSRHTRKRRMFNHIFASQSKCSFLRSSSFPSFCNFDNFLSTASCGDKEAGSEVHWERDMRGEDWDWALWRPLCRLLVLSNCQDDKKQRLWATTDFITTTAPRSSLVPDTNEPLLADCSSSVDGERKCA